MADKTPATPAALDAAPRLVRATRMVFYGGMRIRPGKTFTLLRPSEFSESSMEYADGAPDDTTDAVEASPKTRGSAGVVLKNPAGRRSTGALAPDAGI